MRALHARANLGDCIARSVSILMVLLGVLALLLLQRYSSFSCSSATPSPFLQHCSVETIAVRHLKLSHDCGGDTQTFDSDVPIVPVLSVTNTLW
jgi:hypothetical protein